MNAYEESKQIQEELRNHRRYIHQHPEVGMELFNTANYVEQQLQSYGYQTKRYGLYGISAVVGDSQGCILLRADMDALPMHEESGLPFASIEKGCAHTCGHDLHTAMLLGAAKILKKYEKHLPHKVKFMFQPAEETGEGAKAMLQDGILKDPVVDCAFAMHVDSKTSSGIIVSGSGIGSSTSTVFDIQIEGIGCHGSTPYLGNDPMRIAVQLYQSIQTILSQEIKPDDIAVISIGSIQAGNANNIIPQTAFMKGTIRTFDDKIDSYIKQRIVEITEAITMAFKGKASVQFPATMPSVQNDNRLHQQFISSMNAILPSQQIVETSVRNFASEDFGFVSRSVPSLMIILGANANNPAHGLHHPSVLFHEDCLVYGCAAFVQFALTVFINHEDIEN